MPLSTSFCTSLLVGGDAVKVHVNRMRATNTSDFAFLQDAKQIGLCFEANVANLIEENAAPVGDFKTALFAVLGASEGAFSWPKSSLSSSVSVSAPQWITTSGL